MTMKLLDTTMLLFGSNRVTVP